ncbi:MAG TPA: hypothetical protein VGN57_13315 [Pirellulaceae bacterium]|jgi:hypothetical protein|nr:hypothetical protein [Pirellulaceae bacterium]
MRTLIVLLSLCCCASLLAQTNFEPIDRGFYPYLLTVIRKPPLQGKVLEGDSRDIESGMVRIEGSAKFADMPPQFAPHWMVAAGEGEVTIRSSPMWVVVFFPYDPTARPKSHAATPKVRWEEERAVEYTYTKPVDAEGWFVAWGRPTGVVPTAPQKLLEALYAVENPLKAPTREEELLLIDGLKVKVEAPAEFMDLPEELKDSWVAPVAGGKSGAVLVDSARWQVGFLPFEGGKTKGNKIEPLKGEPIVVDGATVGWRFAKPKPSAGWFVSMGLLPEQPAGYAPKEATAP